MNNTMTNIPTMQISEVVDILANAYTCLINNNSPLTLMPSVMLWGAPGVGKSQGVRQIGEKIEKQTGKKVNITDVRLLLFNPIDLRGIPTANKDKTLALWLKPQIFNMDKSEDVVNILLLDEISAAPQSVQAAAYQITLDRKVGEHELPDNCIVIAAGNRLTDKSVAYKMPKALANRLLHFEVESRYDAWHKWAIENGINEKVIGFIGFKRNRLMSFDPETDDLAFATPRSWEMVSNILNNVEDTDERIIRLISGVVGEGVGVEFKMYLNNYHDLPSIEDIFNGKCKMVPKGVDSLYALSSSMVAYVREHKDDIKKITNSIKYMDLLPVEYSVLTLKDYLYIDEELKKKLLKTKEYVKWLEDKGEILNAII